MTEVRRVGYALGAEVSGVDLREPLDPAVEAAIHRALVEHQVLIFHEQEISPEQLLRFTASFGPVRPMRHPDEILAGYPEIIRVGHELDSPTRHYGDIWHSDGLAFAERPDGVTILHCIDCPEVGGDTAFANQYMAYEGLSRTYRRLLEGLTWHVPRLTSFAHPAVRVHPETGLPHLYLPADVRFCGMTAEESKGIADFVFQVQTSDRVVYRHRWRRRDVVVWENCAVLHRKVGDVAEGDRRVMHRTATQGTTVARPVDARSGYPLDRAIEPNDILRVLLQITCTSQTDSDGKTELLVRAGSSAFTFGVESRAFLLGVARATRFAAKEAVNWCDDGEWEWPEVREALEGLVVDGLLGHDLFA